MSEELAQFSPGVSLEWALFSLGFGIVLLAFIVIRLALEFKRGDQPGEGDVDDAVSAE